MLGRYERRGTRRSLPRHDRQNPLGVAHSPDAHRERPAVRDIRPKHRLSSDERAEAASIADRDASVGLSPVVGMEPVDVEPIHAEVAVRFRTDRKPAVCGGRRGRHVLYRSREEVPLGSSA